MLLVKRWLEEARRDVDEARRLAGEHVDADGQIGRGFCGEVEGEETSSGEDDEKDIRKVIQDEKDRLEAAEGKVKELQKSIQETYRTRVG